MKTAQTIFAIAFDAVFDIVRAIFVGIGELFLVAWESRE